MKRIYSFFIKCSLGFLVGCSVIPTSTEKNPTLLVGKIVFIGSDFTSVNGISFNGTITSGINITLINTATKELLKIFPDENGLFFVTMQEGKYQIDELHVIKTRNDGASAYLYVNPTLKMLEIEKGKVNNIGTIRWSYVDRRHSVIQTGNAVAVKIDFSKQFPKSNWNQKEWRYDSLFYDVKKFSNETITYYAKSVDGQDSALITLPKDMSVDTKRQIETDALNRAKRIRMLGDTTYFVKSYNGLDSALLTIPKAFSVEERQKAEEGMRNIFNKKRSQMGKTDSTKVKTSVSTVVTRN